MSYELSLIFTMNTGSRLPIVTTQPDFAVNMGTLPEAGNAQLP